ncbi:MAG: SMC family ATPase [Thermoproteota archaeon]
MLIERLEIRNFEGYRHAVIDFAKGLNIITGRNSTGKTTLLEAIAYALYGEAPGGRKRLLVSRLQGASGAMLVKITLNVNGRRIEVLREGRLYRRGGSEEYRTERVGLKVDGRNENIHSEEELNRRVSELLGMGVKAFTTLVYARQGELTSILEPKREDMDLILGISLLKELAEQLETVKKVLEKYEGMDAKTMHGMYKRQLPALRKQIEQLAAQASSLSDDVRNLEEMLSKARSAELRGLLALIEERSDLEKRIRSCEDTLRGILIERGAESLERLNQRAAETAQRETELKLKIQGLRAEESRLKEELDDLVAKIKEVEAYLRSAGVFTPEDLELKIKAKSAAYARINVDLEAAKWEFSAAEEKRNTLLGRVNILASEIEEHMRILREGLGSCPTCGQEVDPALLVDLVERKKILLEQVKEEASKFESEYTRLKEKVCSLEAEATRLFNEVAGLRETHSRVLLILNGKTVKMLEEEKDRAQATLEGVRESINEASMLLAAAQSERRALEEAAERARKLEEEKRRLESDLQRCLSNLQAALQALGLQVKPDDPDLKAKVAEQLPLSPEEISRREKDLHAKRQQLSKLKKDLEDLEAGARETERKINELERRLERARLCERLLEKVRGGIEEVRERRLKRIADEALRIYELLTDQRVYKAFRLSDDYTVEVFPSRLEGYIPAKRVGGGHQTLIALAIRTALLRVLNKGGLIVLDEPTYGVDSDNLPQLMSFISEAAKKLEQTILVTHHGFGVEEAANIIRVSIAPDGSSVASKP